MLRFNHRTLALLALTLGFMLGSATACKKKGGDKAKKSGDMTGQMTGDDMAADDMAAPDMAADDMDADDMAAEMTAPDMGADPTLPTKGQAAGRMILIVWKEVDATETVKRSKTEAKALAEKVLKEARAKATEADFTKLAKKHNVGPLNENGGKLSPFGPDDVAPFIAKAVFALKVGGVSDVIESPAGYHIFLRTK